MLVSSQIRAMPSNFLPVPLHGLMVGMRGSLGRNYLCRFPYDGTPGHYTASEPTSSLNTGECPSQQLPTTLTWQAGAPGPFPRVTRPTHCPRGLRHSGPRIQQVTRGHYLTRPPMGPWPTTADKPGARVPTQRYSPFAATLPTRQQGSCTPPNRDRAYFPTNSKTTSILSI